MDFGRVLEIVAGFFERTEIRGSFERAGLRDRYDELKRLG